MPQGNEADTVLIVDDEEPVRRTFREWLEGANLGCQVLTAADAETALLQANRHSIDLAILDWNLGAGNDGLHLLEDLSLFNPDVAAIMITGFAHQATPLDAMRMGVRDYLDKNQDLDRDTFLKAVRKQLDHIRPAKRERHLHRSLVAFREAVAKVLPLVNAAAALNDPVPLPEAVGSLFRFLIRTIGAADGVLLVRSYDASRTPPEICRVYDAGGQPLTADLVPFAHSLAATVVSLQEPYVLSRLDESDATLQLQPFERGRHSLLAAPMSVASGVQVVLELFDKTPSPSPLSPGGRGAGGEGFTEADRRLVAAAADFGVEMLRQALAQRQTHQVLLDAVGVALGASESVAESLRGKGAARPEEPAPAAVMDQLREGLSAAPSPAADAGETLRLAEAVRVLALRHGPAAVRHCTRLIEQVRALLDEATGTTPL